MIGPHLGQRRRGPSKGQLVDAGVDHAPQRHEDEKPQRKARDPQVDRCQDEEERDWDHEEHDAEDDSADRGEPFIGGRHGRKTARHDGPICHHARGCGGTILEEDITHAIAEQDVGEEGLGGERGAHHHVAHFAQIAAAARELFRLCNIVAGAGADLCRIAFEDGGIG